MKQEEKDLLIKDLCARLPYGVKLDTLEGPQELDIRWLSINMCNIASPYLPYLFPLSSMTEEQQIIYGDLCYQIIKATPFEIQNCFNELYNWLIKNNFDYQGLIPMGLAIDATNLNIY